MTARCADPAAAQYCAKLDKSTYEHPLDTYFRQLYKDLLVLHLGQDPGAQESSSTAVAET